MPYQSPGEELNAGDEEPRLGGGDAGLEVLGEPSIAVQPRQCALDHPAAREDIETSRTSRALDNLQGPPTDPLQSRRQLGAGIGTVGEDVTQPGKGGKRSG